MPMAVPAVKEIRMASAPYLSMTSRGSMPFPELLDIFRPRASLTMPWITTVWKGSRPVNSREEKIILATQKKIMS